MQVLMKPSQIRPSRLEDPVGHLHRLLSTALICAPQVHPDVNLFRLLLMSPLPGVFEVRLLRLGKRHYFVRPSQNHHSSRFLVTSSFELPHNRDRAECLPWLPSMDLTQVSLSRWIVQAHLMPLPTSRHLTSICLSKPDRAPARMLSEGLGFKRGGRVVRVVEHLLIRRMNVRDALPWHSRTAEAMEQGDHLRQPTTTFQ